MLVLSRREGESIVIGEDIVVTIVEVRSGQVRLGVEAPRSVDVHREEVYRQVVQENRAAIKAAARQPEPRQLRTVVPDPTVESAPAANSLEPGSVETEA